MSTQAILERERRYRRLAVAASILPLLLLVGSGVIQAGSSTESDLAPAILRSVDENSGPQLIGGALAALAFILLAVPLVYIYKAAQARNERVLGSLAFLVVLGPLLFGVQILLLTVGQVQVASDFLAEEEGVGDIYSLATNLLEDSTLVSSAQIIGFVSGLVLVFGVVYTCLWGVRTGLLTRFHGTLGMALGAAFIFPGLSSFALPFLLAWFMYFGFLLAGRTPRGRPPAWDAGVAIAPPKAGEEPEPVAAGAGGADVVEGDAMEIPGVDENPNAARRERAKKRKRKRRR